MESQHLISVSLSKIAQSRGKRGGASLHRNLLVSTVLHKARHAFMTENFAAMMEVRTLLLSWLSITYFLYCKPLKNDTKSEILANLAWFQWLEYRAVNNVVETQEVIPSAVYFSSSCSRSCVIYDWRNRCGTSTISLLVTERSKFCIWQSIIFSHCVTRTS